MEIGINRDNLIMERLVRNSSRPYTIKARLGWRIDWREVSAIVLIGYVKEGDRSFRGEGDKPSLHCI